VRPHERVNVADGRAANDGPASEGCVGLLMSGVYGLETMQALPELRAQPLVCDLQRSVLGNLAYRRISFTSRFANNVSPPAAGPSRRYKKVVPGGCSSYDTSECQVILFVRS
jgi:hypothetical protein